jgi:vacuolar-type H+-ATPase subunit H
MDEQEALRHLLQVEAEAAALMDDAQAEADKRLAEGEARNRQLYDERYGKAVAELDIGYEKELALVKGRYEEELNAYRKGLETIIVHDERFLALARKLLAV